MKPIQYLLLGLGALLLHLYFARLRSLVWDRIIVVLMSGGVMAMILVPDVTTGLANRVGVGRGVDLVIYLTLFLLSCVCLLMYSKIRNQETRLADLTRALAIDQARIPNLEVFNLPKTGVAVRSLGTGERPSPTYREAS